MAFPAAWSSMRHSLMLVLLNGGSQRSGAIEVCMTRHSLMLVLLNGGAKARSHSAPVSAPLADAGVTDWRTQHSHISQHCGCATR